MFIYIAASDLIPLIHEDAKKKVGHMSAVLFILGIATIAVTTTVAHRYINDGHGHAQESSEEHKEHSEEHADEEAHDELHETSDTHTDESLHQDEPAHQD